MPTTHIEPEQVALSRILRITASKTTKGIMYAVAILGTAALVPGIQIPGVLGAIAATVGIDAISSIIERVAYDDVSDDEISLQIQKMITQLGIDTKITKDEFHHAFGHLFKKQNKTFDQYKQILSTLKSSEDKIEQITDAVQQLTNLVNAYFAADYDLEYPFISKHIIKFDALISEKSERFIGRHSIFNAIDDFLIHSDSGYFIIQGEPGIGKSSIMAQLVKTRHYPHHFNVAPMNIRSARQFLSSTCSQIITRFALPYQSLPESAVTNSGFLVQCLQDAAAKSNGEPIVIIIDALDEAERPEFTRINSLYLPPSLPKGVFIVLTSRPVQELNLQFSHQKMLFLEPDSEDNLLDIKKYIVNFLRIDETLRAKLTEWQISEEFFVQKLAKKSEGNFIYLRYVLPEIGTGKFGDGEIDRLPKGLINYYESHWNQMRSISPADFDEVYSPIVCVLAVAREPVSPEQLSNWTNISVVKVKTALGKWREFLEETTETSEFRIYHSSFQDFLAKKVSLSRFEEMIAKYYINLAQKDEN